MEVVNENINKLKANVGDVICFNSPSQNREGFGYYLICQENCETISPNKFFLINLSGKKGSKIVKYNSLDELLAVHIKKDITIFSADKFAIKIFKKGGI